MAAGVYASRKKIKTLLITESFGGQSIASAEIHNWIGIKSISGLELAKNLENHLRGQEGIEILDDDLVNSMERISQGFKIVTKSGKSLEAKTALVVSGRRRRKLGVSGEKKLEGKGITYCATCDAPLFKNKAVAVIGSGNAGLEAVRDLLSYAEKVYLLDVAGKIIGDSVLFEEIKKDSRVEIILMAEIKEILGDKFVAGLKYSDKKSGQTKELKLEGVFVEIGSVPNVEFLGDLVKKNKNNEIVVDHATQQTSQKGIWAAGDVTDLPYKQNNISAGDAIKATLNIYDHLNRNK